MAILTFPSIVADTQDFGIKYNTQVSTSTISGVNQVVELPGARWKGSLTFRDLTVLESSTLRVFMLELRGSSGTFFYGDITHTAPFDNVLGTPTILTASTPRTIKITLDSGTDNLSPGDYLQIGSDDQRELKMIISSTNTGGNDFDVVIEPMIRRIDYIGLDVVYNNPKGVFMLTADDQGKWSSRSKAKLSDMTLEFIEIFQ
jgi:hypothetical protein